MIDLTQLAIERQLLYTLGSRNSESPIGMTYALTDEGRRWTQEAIKRIGLHRAGSGDRWRSLSTA